MKRIDEIVQICAENPDDHVARRVLSDFLRETEHPDLATAVETKSTGEVLFRELNALAARARLPVTYELLWAAFVLLPRLPQPAANPPISLPWGTTGVTTPSPTLPYNAPEPPFAPPTRRPRRTRPLPYEYVPNPNWDDVTWGSAADNARALELQSVAKAALATLSHAVANARVGRDADTDTRG